MRGDAKRLIYRTWKFHNLVISASIDIPKSDSSIIAHSDDISFGEMEVHAQNRVGMRSEHCLVLLVCFIENAKTSIESTTSYSESIWRDIYSTYCAFVFGLHEEITEV